MSVNTMRNVYAPKTICCIHLHCARKQIAAVRVATLNIHPVYIESEVSLQFIILTSILPFVVRSQW